MGEIQENLEIPKLGGTVIVYGDKYYDEKVQVIKREVVDNGLFTKIVQLFNPTFQKKKIIRARTKVKVERFESRWNIYFAISGPDGRYNPGRATIRDRDLQEVITILEQALSKMKSLEGQSVTGTYFESLYYGGRLHIQLRAEHLRWDNRTRVRAEFGLSSGTNTFYRQLDYDDVSLAIQKLKTVPARVKNMTETLRNMV